MEFPWLRAAFSSARREGSRVVCRTGCGLARCCFTDVALVISPDCVRSDHDSFPSSLMSHPTFDFPCWALDESEHETARVHPACYEFPFQSGYRDREPEKARLTGCNDTR